jgi:hypothetical protein
MATQRATSLLETWADESREAARVVIDTYGEPHEATESLLTWHGVGPWELELSCDGARRTAAAAAGRGQPAAEAASVMMRVVERPGTSGSSTTCPPQRSMTACSSMSAPW